MKQTNKRPRKLDDLIATCQIGPSECKIMPEKYQMIPDWS